MAGFTSFGSGFGGEANLAYRRLLCTARYNHFTGFGNWEMDPITFISSDPQDFQDLAFTLSWLWRNDDGKLLLSAGGGMSYLINQRYLENTGRTVTKSTAGLALGAQANYFFSPYIGVGSSMFGSINSELGYFGVLLHLNAGLVPGK